MAIACNGNELPSCAGKFTFLLPANIPTAYHISLKFRALTGEMLDAISLPILTHYQQTNLLDYWEGHSLPSLELPIPKKQLVGILGIPEAQKIVSYFQELVENGAIGCFRQDQLRLIQHTQTSNHVKAKFQDLLLAVQLEECLIGYQMEDLEGCKRVGEHVCIQANRNHSTNYNALVGRAKSVVSGAYKMEKEFVKAEELLDSSTELLQAVVPGVETSINRTSFAALLCEKADVVGINTSEEKKLKKALKDVIQHYRHQLEGNQSRIARSPRRALIRAILYYLCSTKDKATNLQTDVSHKALTRAEEFAEQFMREFLPNCPMRDRAGFFNAYGDLLTRKGHYEEATHSVSEALKIAEDLRLGIDVKGARDRLQQLNRLGMERAETGRSHPEFAERRVEEYHGFQGPGCEVLQGLLMELERAMN
ncbi:uncharacterized protein LOC111334336 [Stylophora pistillata]|uniref:uncharacterized protein LOC111334336 n=1 Tax=Stylophora pistillata TaxID=50429 RepID=UPI000C0415AD|nr:uncharacterized protein LOC111334336 [Stylophora pistillata]